jgi:glycosyl transferase family 25
MSIFAPYDLIRIISLPHRTDRRREMREQLRNVGMEGDPRVAFVDAVRPPDAGRFGSIGAHGCFLSHLTVLGQAQGGSLLILEDDCDFTGEALTTAVPEGTDVFYGGYMRAEGANLAGDEVIGSHCMGFSARAAAMAERYLASFFDASFVPDARAVREGAFDGVIQPPVDGAYVWFRRAHPELQVHFAEPVAAVQRPSRTDIGDQPFFDRVPGLRTLAAAARRVLR